MSAAQAIEDTLPNGWEVAEIKFTKFNLVGRIGLRDRMNFNAVTWMDLEPCHLDAALHQAAAAVA